MLLESICLINGKIQNRSMHIKRMRTTGLHFRFTPPDLPDIEGMLAPGMDEVKLKCRITYHTNINSIAFEHYHPKTIKSLKLVVASPDYAFKFSDRTVLNDLLNQKNGCEEILIVRNGLITDTSFSNVVLSKGDELHTPAYPLLNGTKRQKLLNEGRIKEAQITPDNLKEYDRLYLINAMLDIEDDVYLSIDSIFE